MSELVFKRNCNRCPAVQEVPLSFDEIKAGKDPTKDRSRAVKISVGGQVFVSHEYLCDACIEICSRYVKNIGRQLEKRSALRERSEEED
jgi:hypothetical protein